MFIFHQHFGQAVMSLFDDKFAETRREIIKEPLVCLGRTEDQFSFSSANNRNNDSSQVPSQNNNREYLY